MITVSNTFYIVLPITALVGMFGWLALVFWASAHPQWKSQRTAVKRAGPTRQPTAQAGAGPAAVSGREGTGGAGQPAPARPRHAA